MCYIISCTQAKEPVAEADKTADAPSKEAEAEAPKEETPNAEDEAAPAPEAEAEKKTSPNKRTADEAGVTDEKKDGTPPKKADSDDAAPANDAAPVVEDKKTEDEPVVEEKKEAEPVAEEAPAPVEEKKIEDATEAVAATEAAVAGQWAWYSTVHTRLYFLCTLCVFYWDLLFFMRVCPKYSMDVWLFYLRPVVSRFCLVPCILKIVIELSQTYDCVFHCMLFVHFMSTL